MTTKKAMEELQALIAEYTDCETPRLFPPRALGVLAWETLGYCGSKDWKKIVAELKRYKLCPQCGGIGYYGVAGQKSSCSRCDGTGVIKE